MFYSENLDQQLKKANRQTVEKVLAPLFVLREASVNPRVNFIIFSSISNFSLQKRSNSFNFVLCYRQ